MKALSIRQPWAWLVTCGQKDVENRTWRTNYRGPVLIHAAQKIDFDFRTKPSIVLKNPGLQVDIDYNALYFGGIIGRVDLIDIISASRSPWFSGPYGWILANAEPLPFRPLRGTLGLFDVLD